MPQEKQTKTNTRKILLVIIFILMIGFGFGRGEKAEAEDMCAYSAKELGKSWKKLGNISKTDCIEKCKEQSLTNTICYWKKDYTSIDDLRGDVWEILKIDDKIKDLPQIKSAPNNPEKEAACNWMANPIDCLLLTLLRFMVVMSQLASSLFIWILDPINVTSVLSNSTIYSAWTMVRDVLNISFIMFLLFSAFATVFQIDKYSYKKTLLMIVIMALLVNFSFPITRFIIDVSNMMMYYFISALNMDGAKIMVDFASNAKLPEIINSNNVSTTALLTAVVFVFIFAVTILTITVLFVIRTIALAILIIFSSLAFIGAAIPPLSKYSNDWWGKLFSYAFFGPIMLFMIYVSSSLMSELSKTGFKPMQIIASGQTKDANFVASLSLFVIPIVILWMGLGIAQSMSIAGAGAVVGKAQGFMKGAGKWAMSPVTGAYKAGKWGIGAGIKKIDRDHIGVRGFIKAWKDRATEVDTDKVASQTAKSRDLISNFPLFFDRGKRPKNFYREVDDENKILKYKKEQDLFSKSEEEVVASIQKLEGKKDIESGQRMQAFFRTLAEEKNLNEFRKKRGKYFNAYETKDDIYDTIEKTSGEKVAIDALHDLEDMNLANGVYSMYGLTIMDATTNKRRKTTHAEQKQLAMGKMMNIDYQKLMINFHPDSVIDEDTNGNPIGLNDMGVDMLKYIESRDAKFVERLRGDAKDKIRQAIIISDMTQGTNIAATSPNLKKALNLP